MTPAWLDAWLGAPLDSLDAERLGIALEAARRIADRLAQEQDQSRSRDAQQEFSAIHAEWQAAIAVLQQALKA